MTDTRRHVRYQLTQDETDVWLSNDYAALTALRVHIAQALREAGDPSHCDVFTSDGQVAFTMDQH